MGIKDEANGLDSALKKGTNSARSLSLALAAGNNNLGLAVHAAAELAEALAKASKAARIAEMATGIGVVVAAIGTVIAATVSWIDKEKEIAQSISEVQAATRALNAEAANNPRAAQEERITAEKNKQLAAIEKEQAAMFGLNKHLHDYSKLLAAVNAQAAAAERELVAGINRQFLRTREDLAGAARQQTPGLGFLSDLQRQLALNREARAEAIRHQQEQGADQGMEQFQIDELVATINDQFNNAAELIKNDHIKPLGDELGRSFAGSIADGIASGVASGSIEKGFRALAGGMLVGLGQMMVTIGTQSLLAANLFTKIIQAFQEFAPEGAIGPSLALIALGGLTMGLGAALGAGGGHGGGGGYGGGYGGGGTTIIDRGLINPANSAVMSPGILVPRESTTIFLIGEDDPRAQRSLYNMVNKAKTRIGES